MDEILNKKYMTADDLIVIIPELSKRRAITYINEAQKEMREQNYFIPITKKKVALTKIIRKKFGF